MAVLFYQLFIVATLVVLRIFGGKALLGGALVWSCLTLANLFFPPLILLQLIVVWVTYAVLAPRSQTNTADTASRTPVRIQPPPPSPPLVSAPLKAASAFALPEEPARLDLWDIVEQGAGKASLAPEVATLLSKRRAALDVEAAFIELILGRATAQMDRVQFLAAADAQTKEIYFQERARRTARLETPMGPRAKRRYDDFAFTDDGPPEHPDSMARVQLRRGWAIIEGDHDALLQGVITKLKADEGLRGAFKTLALEGGASRLLPRLDDKASGGLWLNAALAECAGLLTTVPDFDGACVTSPPSNDHGSDEVALRALEIERSPLFPPDALAIRRLAEEKNVPHLVHFTSLSNLESILTHGLQPVADAQAYGLNPRINDELRLDRRRHATSTSVAFPNAAMFWKYRQMAPGSQWVVLLLDRSILWKQECYFCRHNAADSRIIKLSPQELMKPEAFAAMFDEAEGLETRERQKLNVFDPTDPQAEVMVLGVIPPEAITAVVFNDPALAATSSHLVKERTIEVHEPTQGYYGQRTFARTRQDWN